MGIQSIETISLCSILNSSTHGLNKFKCIAATPSLTFGFGRLSIQCGVRFRPCIDIHKYVFNNGKMDLERLKDLVCVVGKQRLVLDLSCRKKDVRYVIVTDRWQKFSDVYLCKEVPGFLANYADEFLVHGVDFEEKRLGIDEELVALLGKYSGFITFIYLCT